MKIFTPLLVGLLLICGCTVRHVNTQDPVTLAGERSRAVRGAFGTYNAPPRLDNGRTDLDRLLSDLLHLRANTYHWLIWHNARDWDDLQAFLPMARKHRIKVWVTVVPPSESPPHMKS